MPNSQNFDAKLIRIAIHGGAGDMPVRDHGYAEHQAVLKDIVEQVAVRLDHQATALDAAQFAVQLLEDHPLFNAGHGAVLNSEGVADMDAAIMDGSGRAGAVAGVQRVKNPVGLARFLLDDGTHVMIAGAPCDSLAERVGLPVVDPSYFVTDLRKSQLERAQQSGGVMLDHDEQVGKRDKPPAADPAESDAYGTVGAVIRDGFGHVAAATSTGGMTNKHPGRVGDSPLIGAGTWASNATCAVSCTGHGEAFIRHNVAAQIHWRMVLGQPGLRAASETALSTAAQAENLGGKGGLIAISAQGEVVMPYNTAGMFRGWLEGGEKPKAAVF